MLDRLRERVKKWNHKRLADRHAGIRLVRMERKIDELERLVSSLAQGIVDPVGLSMAKLRMNVLKCPDRYQYIICSAPKNALVIDGGANLGLFSDLMLGLGARVIAFEPNPILCKYLRCKYKLNEKDQTDSLALISKAIACEEKSCIFSMTTSGDFISASQGGSLDVVPNGERLDFDVDLINFADYLKSLVDRGERPYLIKLDIEGTEFEVLDKLIEEDLCSHFDYLVCETHERFFMDGNERLRNLKQKLRDRNIRNVFLDWI